MNADNVHRSHRPRAVRRVCTVVLLLSVLSGGACSVSYRMPRRRDRTDPTGQAPDHRTTSEESSSSNTVTEPDPQTLMAQVSDSTARRMRRLWIERTRGDRLALGRPVRFRPQPGYRLTTDVGDPRQLTDGRLAVRPGHGNDAIWFSQRAVGWWQFDGVVEILIDLGEPRPVGRVVVRTVGGRPQPIVAFPKEIEIFAGLEPHRFERVGRYERRLPGAGDRSAEGRSPETAFHLPQDGAPTVYPFLFGPLDVTARYIGVRIAAPSHFVCLDEIAVLAADSGDTRKPDPGAHPRGFTFAGVAARPWRGELVASSNAATPLHLWVRDYRRPDRRGGKGYVNLELPRGLEVMFNGTRGGSMPPRPVTRDGQKRTLWTFEANTLEGKPIYILPPERGAPPRGVTARITGFAPGEPQNVCDVPLRWIELPEVPRMRRYLVSLAWMTVRQQRNWPGFFGAWRRLGFNAVGAFPRWWPDGEAAERPFREHLEEARRRGFSVVYNESPFHVMMDRFGEADEVYSQLENGSPGEGLCPSYRGEFYVWELKRIARAIERVGPDAVFWDSELWEKGVAEAPRCRRCQANFRKGGYSEWDALMADLSQEVFGHLRTVVERWARSKDRKPPPIGLYNFTVTTGPFMDFEHLYPGAVQLTMPSLYVQGDALAHHRAIRRQYEVLKAARCIPWLTTGTYGEFEPWRIEPMLYECFLNGIVGIAYFKFADFDDAEEFLYHARALRTLAPFEELLWNGKPLPARTDNDNLTVSAWGSKNEMLVLVGNYRRGDAQTGRIQLPLDNVTAIRDLLNHKNLEAKKPLTVTVPSERAVLLHVKGRGGDTVIRGSR